MPENLFSKVLNLLAPDNHRKVKGRKLRNFLKQAVDNRKDAHKKIQLQRVKVLAKQKGQKKEIVNENNY